MTPKTSQCADLVSLGSRWPTRCTRDAIGHDKDGRGYCAIHSPEAKAKRRDRSDQRYADKSAKEAAARSRAVERMVRESPIFREVVEVLRALVSDGNTLEASSDDPAGLMETSLAAARSILARLENPTP